MGTLRKHDWKLVLNQADGLFGIVQCKRCGAIEFITTTDKKGLKNAISVLNDAHCDVEA